MPEPESVPKENWSDLQPVLDEELSRLPETNRLLLLLCDLEGKSIKEAAQQLGWPQGTLASRLTRASQLPDSPTCQLPEGEGCSIHDRLPLEMGLDIGIIVTYTDYRQEGLSP